MKKSKWISMLVMIIASLSFAGKVWANTEQSIWQLEKTTNLVQHYLYDKNDNRASKVVDGTSLFWLKNNGHEIGGYCIDLNVPAKINADYKAEDLEDLKTETEKQYKNNEDKIRTIITSSYPSLTLETLKKNSKIDGLTENEAVRATQLLIWKILHKGTYQKEETIRTYEAKLFDDKKFTGSEDIDVTYHHVISINDNGYQRRFPMSAADITIEQIGKPQHTGWFWRKYYLNNQQKNKVNTLHKESAERVYKLYQYLDNQKVEKNPREEIGVTINDVKLTSDNKITANFTTKGTDLSIKAKLLADGKVVEEKNNLQKDAKQVEFKLKENAKDAQKLSIEVEISQKLTKINSLISAKSDVITQTIIGVEPIVTYNTAKDKKEIQIPAKPTYKAGELKTTVNVGGVSGSQDKAAIIEIGEDTITKDVIDTVGYSNLKSGEQYTLTGTLMKIIDGSEPVAVKTSEAVIFTAEENGGTVEVRFKNVALEANTSYVVYEKAESVKEYTYQEEGKEVTKKHQAIHENPKDKAQTIVVNQTDIETGHSEIIETDENTAPGESGSYDDRTVIETEEDTWKPTYKKGTLATTVNVGDAIGSKDKAATIEISEDTVTTNVTDTIDYKDLFAGVEYQVTGKLMDITNINNPVEVATATTTFTPQVATGTTSITFKGVTLTANHKYVVYEYAESTTNREFVDGNKPHKAEHADPKDKAQTIVVNQTNIETGHSEIIDIDENTAPGESGSYDDKTVIETEEGNSEIIDIDENTAPGESGSYDDKTVIETEEGNSEIIDIDENTAPGESGSYDDKTVIETEEGNSEIIDIDENTAPGESGSYDDKTVIETEEDTWKPTYQTGNLTTTVKLDNVTGTSDQAATIAIGEDTVTKDIIDIVKYINLKSGE
ncbi:VaFE repeat-containing surface-anchored protein, partial [Granulicatella balaenopterae]